MYEWLAVTFRVCDFSSQVKVGYIHYNARVHHPRQFSLITLSKLNISEDSWTILIWFYWGGGFWGRFGQNSSLHVHGNQKLLQTYIGENVVHRIAPSFLIGSLSNLQVKRTDVVRFLQVKSTGVQMSLLSGQIRLHTLQSLYNATHYNMDLVITWPGIGSQMVVFLLFLYKTIPL